MRALLFAALAAAAVVGLAGCGQESTPASEKPAGSGSTVASTETPPTTKPPKPPAGTPSAPVSVGPSGVVVPEGVTQVPADQVDASALPAYYNQHGQVWVFDDGYSLALFAAANSSCTDAEAVVVDQSASDVRITVRPLPNPPGGRPDDGVCAEVITPRPVTVRLDEPLGDRMIYLGIGR